MTNSQQPRDPIKIDKERAIWKTDQKQLKPTLSDSDKQEQSSRNTQHGQKDDNDKKQSTQLIGSATLQIQRQWREGTLTTKTVTTSVTQNPTLSFL